MVFSPARHPRWQTQADGVIAGDALVFDERFPSKASPWVKTTRKVDYIAEFSTPGSAQGTLHHPPLRPAAGHRLDLSVQGEAEGFGHGRIVLMEDGLTFDYAADRLQLWNQDHRARNKISTRLFGFGQGKPIRLGQGKGDVRAQTVGNAALLAARLADERAKGIREGKELVEPALAQQTRQPAGPNIGAQEIAGALILHGRVKGLGAGQIGKAQIDPDITFPDCHLKVIGQIGVSQRALIRQPWRKDDRRDLCPYTAASVLDRLHRGHVRTRIGRDQDTLARFDTHHIRRQH